MQIVTHVIYKTVFGYIAMTKNPIGCDSAVNYKSPADYISLVIQRVAVEAIIVFITGRVTT